MCSAGEPPAGDDLQARTQQCFAQEFPKRGRRPTRSCGLYVFDTELRGWRPAKCGDRGTRLGLDPPPPGRVAQLPSADFCRPVGMSRISKPPPRRTSVLWSFGPLSRLEVVDTAGWKPALRGLKKDAVRLA